MATARFSVGSQPLVVCLVSCQKAGKCWALVQLAGTCPTFGGLDPPHPVMQGFNAKWIQIACALERPCSSFYTSACLTMLRQCSRRIAARAVARQANCAALDSCAPGGGWSALHTERCCEGRPDGVGSWGHAPQACWMPWSPNRGFAAEAAVQQPDTPDVLLRRRVSEANMVLQVCCHHRHTELCVIA